MKIMIVEPFVSLIDIALQTLTMPVSDMRVCEFGNQYMRVPGIPHSSGKEYFESLGAKHISLDLNGRTGSIKMDLSKDVLLMHPEWAGAFDLVTDFGTIEHVENGVYEAFLNAHNLCRKGGVMLHTLPLSGCWPGHSPYHFDDVFFPRLALCSKYVVVVHSLQTTTYGKHSRKPKTNVSAVMIKSRDEPFMSKEQFVGLLSVCIDGFNETMP